MCRYLSFSLIIFSTSSTMRSAELSNAIRSTLALSEWSLSSSLTVASMTSTNFSGASASVTMMAASRLARARAFFVWWSSATFGEGTKMEGLPSNCNSLMLLAPAREITRSAARYAISILLMNGI